MTSTRDEIITEIGQAIMRAANHSADNWSYAGYVFSANNTSTEMIDFMFDASNERGFLEDREWFKPLRENFKRFREVTRVDGDDYWIKCKAVLRKSDGKLKMLFEFEDTFRWSISPSNVDQAYEILIGDIFPEALEGN